MTGFLIQRVPHATTPGYLCHLSARYPCGRAGSTARRGTGAGLKAADHRLEFPGARDRVELSAVVWSDLLELLGPGLSAPGEVTRSCVGLLALGGLEAIG